MPSRNAQKSHGVVYTPPETVDMVLDIAGYVVGSGIVGKTVLEPSCGDGAFLRTITDRLLTEYGYPTQRFLLPISPQEEFTCARKSFYF